MTNGVGTGVANCTTMTSVEPWSNEPTASAVPTTTPSAKANGRDKIVPVAVVMSVMIPGCWTMTVCCAWTPVQIMMQRVRAKSVFFIIVDSFLVELKRESSLIPMKEYLFEK